MAKANPKTRTSKRARTLAISTAYSHCREDKDGQYDRHVCVPSIRIRGGWLQQAGFYCNNRVRVELKRRGRLVITQL